MARPLRVEFEGASSSSLGSPHKVLRPRFWPKVYDPALDYKRSAEITALAGTGYRSKVCRVVRARCVGCFQGTPLPAVLK